jgi:hypothetical protein
VYIAAESTDLLTTSWREDGMPALRIGLDTGARVLLSLDHLFHHFGS